MITIKRALVSVSDKTGIVEFCRVLRSFNVEILSTGGTAKLLREHNITVMDVSEFTGFPEMLDGRVKTLHPKVHGGLLALRENQEHMQTVKQHGIGLIDMVVVNLYPFEKTVAKAGVTRAEAIENIDIGGPSMLRSAAKNHQSVAVICQPSQYEEASRELQNNKGKISKTTCRRFARDVFLSTSCYDRAIYEYLNVSEGIHSYSASSLPVSLSLKFTKLQDLRYGENPHQQAAFYKEDGASGGLINLRQLQGKELSFNNILDLNSVWELLKEFKNPAAVIVKHNNPCGAAEARMLDRAYQDAYDCDPLSAFGGIVGLNRAVDFKTARRIAASGFIECIIAPSFSSQALELFARKKNLRILELKGLDINKEYDFKRVSGGLLVQDKDTGVIVDNSALKVVTSKKPTRVQISTLLFAWKVAKHVKSNAIVLAQGTKTVGIGAGQMSRVESMIIAKRKAGKRAVNSCLASDGFFPKPDTIAEAARAGVKAIIQPGGSIADQEIITACNTRKIAMVTTGMRHFRH